MSDSSMAFIGGVAVAGLAAILLLKSPQGFSTASIPLGYQQPIPQAQGYGGQTAQYPGQPAPTQPYPNGGPNYDTLRQDNDRLNEQIRRMQDDNGKLQYQVQNLQFANDSLTNQLKANNLPPVATSQVTAAGELNRTPSNPLVSGIVWAVGGMALAIGGGVVVAGVLALFSQKNNSGGRTVQVIHPIHPNHTLSPSVRRSEVLPPPRRMETRQTEAQDYDLYS